eukprot:COSAG01_NODE_6911_length_3443_cov_3.818746_2_plen_77_part_00
MHSNTQPCITLTSTGIGGGGAEAADFIDLTSGVEHFLEQGQAIAHLLRNKPRLRTCLSLSVQRRFSNRLSDLIRFL